MLTLVSATETGAASGDNFFSAIARMKQNFGPLVSNVFSNAHELKKLIETRPCFTFETGVSAFLLHPLHGLFYDCLFYSANIENLNLDLAKLLACYTETKAIRASIVVKEPPASALPSLFEGRGFVLQKKLARLSQTPEQAERLRKLQLDLGEEVAVGFAVAEDAEEIYGLLLGEFDPVGDNLPELSGVQEGIEKRQFVVVRYDNKIASMHHFVVKNSCAYFWYDITRKEYRQRLFLAHIWQFFGEYFKKNGITIRRNFQWRDCANNRLLNNAIKHQATLDGIYIYNFSFSKQGLSVVT